MDLFLRVLVLLLLTAWRIYWSITERTADQEKPKTKAPPSFFSSQSLVRNAILLLVGFMLVFPLLGFPIFPMEGNMSLQLFGVALVVIGLGLSVVARHELGTNWANAYEYQVKHKQTLVTTGIYAYVRHPIYSGMIVAAIGADLVAQSYLFIVFIFFFLYAYQQGKNEDKLLEKHFGKAYTTYKKKTKMPSSIYLLD